MARIPVATKAAPAAIGPYSQGIVWGNLLFVSGQLGMDPATGQLEPDTLSQARRALENLKAILAEAGFSLEDVVKTTIFLLDLADFAAVNEVYAGFFPEAPPARSTVQVARLPKDARVEIEAIAAR
ncbi:MAG: RidA family protein [Bacillota bacterium]|nr:RidA family protein [Bacillota bacterium]